MRHLVVAMGAFDGVHLGHQALIRQVLTIAERDHLTSGVVTFEPHQQLDVYKRQEQIWADTSYGEQELQWHAEIPIEESLRRAWHWQEALDKRDKTTN